MMTRSKLYLLRGRFCFLAPFCSEATLCTQSHNQPKNIGTCPGLPLQQTAPAQCKNANPLCLTEINFVINLFLYCSPCIYKDIMRKNRGLCPTSPPLGTLHLGPLEAASLTSRTTSAACCARRSSRLRGDGLALLGQLHPNQKKLATGLR